MTGRNFCLSCVEFARVLRDEQFYTSEGQNKRVIDGCGDKRALWSDHYQPLLTNYLAKRKSKNLQGQNVKNLSL